jgi:hypothetical protein
MFLFGRARAAGSSALTRVDGFWATECDLRHVAVARRGLFALRVSRIECAAIRAMDQYPMNFALLGMEQDRVAVPADIIH